MTKMFLALTLWILAVPFLDGHCTGYSQQAFTIIPQPASLRVTAGRFRLTSSTSIVVTSSSKELRFIAEQFAERVRGVTGLPLPLLSRSPRPGSGNTIILRLNPNNRSIPKEGYRLSVTQDSVRILASSGAGIFYGVQSLIQLYPPEVRSKSLGNADWSVQCVEIVDSARFTWRGMHLDVGRHFFSKEFIKKYINLMASYKLNTFHWHLTDDQGWRIEIKKYPALTGIGSKRSQTTGDSTPYGGFYSQEDIREVVQYARERFVTVVPEIEMPGHSLAALAAHPEFSCTGGPFTVGTEWGVFEDVYCAGNDKTFAFLESILEEVIRLFPGEVIHIGGDEVPKTRWKACPKCQARMRSEGLANEDELQSYFIRRIEKFLNAKGKRIIGWDEILEGGIAPNASVMSWRGTEGGIAAAKAGHDVVMTPGTYCYFDQYQARSGEPKAIGGFLPIDSVYAYDPVPAELDAAGAAHIRGAQGNMWTEYMPDEKHVEYMLMPRMLALSEMLWLPKNQRNFSGFMRRVNSHYDRLTLRDVNFRVPPPEGIGGRMFIFGDTALQIRPGAGNATIRYTVDGTEPNLNSPAYSGPIPVHGNEVLVARTFMDNGRVSNPVATTFVVVDPKINGLKYTYWEGAWDSLPDFTIMQPTGVGKTFDIALDGFPHRNENYALRLDGFLRIEEDTPVTFSLTSDDGSSLYIDDKLVINNDYLHPPRTVSSTTTLGIGKHRIRIDFFQRTGGVDLQLEMESARMPRQRVPLRLISEN